MQGNKGSPSAGSRLGGRGPGTAPADGARSCRTYARHMWMKRGRNTCGPSRKELVAAGQVVSHRVLVVVLETGLKKSLKQRPYVSLGVL